jgi:hypothetical protein
MQHPFFNESLVRQRMQILQREAEMERATSSIEATVEAKEKDRARTLLRNFGLTCFGVGLLAGSLLMKMFGLLLVIIAAVCICVLVTLPVLVRAWPLLKKPGGAARLYKLTN